MRDELPNAGQLRVRPKLRPVRSLAHRRHNGALDRRPSPSVQRHGLAPQALIADAVPAVAAQIAGRTSPSPPMLWPLARLDAVFVVGFLVLLSGTLIPMVVGLVGEQGRVPIWPFYFALYAITTLMALQRGRLTMAGIRTNPALWFLVALAAASAIWSLLPGETIAASLTLAGPMLFAVALASGIKPQAVLRLMAIASAWIIAANWLAIVALPSIGIQPDGPWAGTPRGFNLQKNGLGSTALVGVMVLTAHFASGASGRRLWGVLAGIAGLGLLVASRSTTSFVLAAMGFAVFVAPRRVLVLVAIAFPVVLGTGAALLAFAPDLLGRLLADLTPLVGKDPTLSNRLPIWQVLRPFIEGSPWVGYGYGVFWHDSVSPQLLFVQRLGFDPGSAHNGLIEIWLALGLVGVAAMIGGLIHFFMLAARAVSTLDHDQPIARLALAIGVLQVVHNATESSFLSRNDLGWLVFVWLWATLGVLLARARATTPAP